MATVASNCGFFNSFIPTLVYTGVITVQQFFKCILHYSYYWIPWPKSTTNFKSSWTEVIDFEWWVTKNIKNIYQCLTFYFEITQRVYLQIRHFVSFKSPHSVYFCSMKSLRKRNSVRYPYATYFMCWIPAVCDSLGWYGILYHWGISI